MAFQRLDAGIEAAEDEPLVTLHVRHRCQSLACAFRGATRPALRFVFHMGAFALGVVAPSMEATCNCLHRAPPPRSEYCATMGTGIDESANAVIFLADDEDWLLANICCVIIAMFDHLTFVTEIYPGLAENAFHLSGEHRWVGVKASVDAKDTVFGAVFDELGRVVHGFSFGRFWV